MYKSCKFSDPPGYMQRHPVILFCFSVVACFVLARLRIFAFQTMCENHDHQLAGGSKTNFRNFKNVPPEHEYLYVAKKVVFFLAFQSKIIACILSQNEIHKNAFKVYFRSNK